MRSIIDLGLTMGQADERVAEQATALAALSIANELRREIAYLNDCCNEMAETIALAVIKHENGLASLGEAQIRELVSHDVAELIFSDTPLQLPSTKERLNMSDQTSAPSQDAPPADAMLQFFDFEHLPPRLQTVSRNFHSLAQHIVTSLPRNPERTAALRKLLEAKDCAVRAVLFK